MRVRRAGEQAVLVELDDLDAVLRLAAELRRRRPLGVVDVVPAARTVLIAGPGSAAVAREIPGWTLPPAPARVGPALEIPVRYDGPDLDEVLNLTGLARDALIDLHTSAPLLVAFCGFAPGFAYLAGLPERLHVPRRPTPRPQVPGGAVGLAGEFTGVYPRASPGGWQIIGHTSLALWDAARDPPALLAPGTRVRFVAQP